MSAHLTSDSGSFEVRRLTDPDVLAGLLREEPVNPVGDDRGAFAEALRDRTDIDRRVYGLVGPAAPEHPATVVWVALTRGVPASLAELTDRGPALAPETADTAVFWSIWKVDPERPGGDADRGDRGPSGGELIEGAVRLLRAELPGLRTSVTLSPVPGLRRWIHDQRATHGVRVGAGSSAGAPPSDELGRLAARYLTSLDDTGRPLDPVARFHLGNGASLWRINPDADPSDLGMERSYGVMANYRYEPEDRDANRRRLDQAIVTASHEVMSLL